MPIFERPGVSIRYEERGSGFPILLIAPGGMRSAIDFWENAPWNPIEHLGDRYRVTVPDDRVDFRVAAAVAVGLDALMSR